MIDTCQANTMYSKIYSPNIVAIGSSELGQSSYSHHSDNEVGVAVIDRFTYYNLEFLESQVNEPSSKKTMGNLIDGYDVGKIHSNPGIRYDLFPGGEQAVRERLVMDFFGNSQNVEVEANRASQDSNWHNDLHQLAEMAKKIANNTNTNKKTVAPTDRASSTKSNYPLNRQDNKAPFRVDIEQHWNERKVGLSVLIGILGICAISAWLDGRG